MSPPLTSRMTASTISPMTNELSRGRARDEPPVRCSRCFSAPATSWLRAIFTAGTRPQITAVRSDSRKANPSTRASTRKSPRKSASDIAWIGLRAAITGVIQKARSAPSPPPPSARSKVSLSSCLTIRPGLAPSAKRMPISRSRTTPRTSKRLARFAQQINNTKPTAAERVRSAFLLRPSISPSKWSRSPISL